jgi:hypothetical protein
MDDIARALFGRTILGDPVIPAAIIAAPSAIRCGWCTRQQGQRNESLMIV